MTKRGLALLLTLVLCAGILQLPVLAADESAGTVQEAAIQDVTEETVTPSGPDTPADTTAPDADGSDDTTAPDADGSDDTTAPDADVPEDDTAPSDFSSKIPEAIEPPVTPAKPAKPTDGDISLFYDENNIAVIVRCADRRDSKPNGSLKHLAKGSYTIGEVEAYDGSNRDLSTDEWLWMCKVHVNQEYYLKLWHKNFEKTYGTHYLKNEGMDVYATFYYFKGGFCDYAWDDLEAGWYCLTEDAPVYVDITQGARQDLHRCLH